MAKKIKVEVLKNFYNAISVLEIENGKNHRKLLFPNHEEELDAVIAPIAKEVWTDDIKESYKNYLELNELELNE